MSQIIGTCGNCGGPVVWPSMMVDPHPICKSCGATPKQKYGPVIEMEPRPSAGTAAVPPGVEWKPNTAGGHYP